MFSVTGKTKSTTATKVSLETKSVPLLTLESWCVAARKFKSATKNQLTARNLMMNDSVDDEV